MGSLITNVNFSKKEASFFDKVKDTVKRFTDELGGYIDEMRKPETVEVEMERKAEFKMPIVGDEAVAMQTDEAVATEPEQVVTVAENAELVEPTVAAEEEKELDLSLATIVDGDYYLDEGDDGDVLAEMERLSLRRHDRAKIKMLFRGLRYYRGVALQARKVLEASGETVNLEEIREKPDSEKSKAENQFLQAMAEVERITEVLSKKFYHYGCTYGVSAINENDFSLLSDAYAGSLDDRIDAQLVREFMQCEDLSVSMRVTLFYKLVTGKNTINDLWKMASLSCRGLH